MCGVFLYFRIPHKLQHIWQMSYGHGETKIIETVHKLCKIWYSTETGFWRIPPFFHKKHKWQVSAFFRKKLSNYPFWVFVSIIYGFVYCFFFRYVLFPWKTTGKHTRPTFLGMYVISHVHLSFPRSPQSFPESAKKGHLVEKTCMYVCKEYPRIKCKETDWKFRIKCMHVHVKRKFNWEKQL